MGNCLTAPTTTPLPSPQSEAALSETDVARALTESLRSDDSHDGSSAMDQRPPTPTSALSANPVRHRQPTSADAQRLLLALTATNRDRSSDSPKSSAPQLATFSASFHVTLRRKANEARCVTRVDHTHALPTLATHHPRSAAVTTPLASPSSTIGKHANPFVSILGHQENCHEEVRQLPTRVPASRDALEPQRESSRKSKTRVTFVE